MALPLFSIKRREFTSRPIELMDAAQMADLHEEGFLRSWSHEEFASLIIQETVIGYAVVEVGIPDGPLSGFVLARHAAGEAEILTIVVSAKSRKRGLGRMLMDAILRHLHSERVDELFLEVDEINSAAVALYRRLGFENVGCRLNYYDHPDAKRTNALVMRLGV